MSRSSLERVRLSNGLTVLYTQASDMPLAAGTLLVRSGSFEDPPGKEGLCHLASGLLLQGTRRSSARRLAERFESMGAALGAQAADDYSEFGFLAPENELEDVLRAAGEIVREPAFVPSEIAKEKAHTLASLRSRQDTLFNLAHDEFMKRLYGGHPYGRLTEGTVKSLAGISRRDLRAWHEYQWTPSRGVLSLTAGWPWRMMRARVERALEGWRDPRQPAIPAETAPIPPHDRAERFEIRSHFEQAYLMTGLLAPDAFGADAMALKVLNTLVGGGMSSRLFVKLREEMGLAYDVYSFFPTRLRSSHWIFYLGCSPDRLNAADHRLRAVLDELASRGATRAEVEQAKAMIRGNFMMDRQTRRRRAWYLAWWEFLGRGAAYDDEFLKRLDAISLRDVNRLAETLLSRPRLTVRVVPS